MFKKRLALISLLGACLFVCGLDALFPIASTVSLHVRNVPLSEAITRIEWQGWVKIVVNVDKSEKVSLDLDHVTVQQALDAISRQTHSRWKWAWFVAPNHHELAKGEALFDQNSSLNSKSWKAFAASSSASNEQPFGCSNLQDNLRLITSHQDILTLVPTKWNPLLAPMDSNGKLPMYSTVPELAAWAGGTSEQVILLTGVSSY